MFLQTREMTYEEFFVELANCHPGSQYYTLNVIDVRTLPKAIYTVPEMVADNSINHLADREIGSREPSLILVLLPIMSWSLKILRTRRGIRIILRRLCFTQF